MTAADWLTGRQGDWERLESLLANFESGALRRKSPEDVLKLGQLYRSACADLAMSDGYNLPDATVHYLHQLVARAHNQVYRVNNHGTLKGLLRKLFLEVPALAVGDSCVAIAFVLFWGCFGLSTYAAYVHPRFAESAVGAESLCKFEEMYSKPMQGRSGGTDTSMAGFYVQHNTSIGLACFGSGVFLGLGSIVTLTFNAIMLGAVFGHMAGSPVASNFFHFVTAHSVCELTAIVLSAGAGLRLGFSVIDAKGRSRKGSLQQEGLKALKIVGLAGVLFTIAALIEGYVSPSSLPYPIKATVALLSAIVLGAYVFVLGRKARSVGVL